LDTHLYEILVTKPRKLSPVVMSIKHHSVNGTHISPCMYAPSSVC